MSDDSQHRERRQGQRRGLTFKLPISLRFDDDRSTRYCRVTNVSKSGLQVMVEKPLETGVKVTLTTLSGNYGFEVAYCEGHSEGYRCGLQSLEDDVDLDGIFGVFMDRCA